jgi:hypothetical protein
MAAARPSVVALFLATAVLGAAQAQARAVNPNFDVCAFSVEARALTSLEAGRGALAKSVAALAPGANVTIRLDDNTNQVALIFSAAADADAFCSGAGVERLPTLLERSAAFGDDVELVDPTLGSSKNPLANARACYYSGACTW